jgi:hypothetical protein
MELMGKSDIEGKTAREAASELGKQRVSNECERMSKTFAHQLVPSFGKALT